MTLKTSKTERILKAGRKKKTLYEQNKQKNRLRADFSTAKME